MYISFATFHQHLAIFSRPFRTYINIASILHLREEACRIIPFAVIGYMQQESSRRMASRRLGMGAHFQGAHIPWWGRLRYQIERLPSRAKSKRRARLNSINTHVVVSCVGADAVCLSMRSLDKGIEAVPSARRAGKETIPNLGSRSSIFSARFGRNCQTIQIVYGKCLEHTGSPVIVWNIPQFRRNSVNISARKTDVSDIFSEFANE